MQRHEGFDKNHWNRSGWNDRPSVRGGESPLAALGGVLKRTGLWAAACLATASLAPSVLVAPLLREMLLLSAVFHSLAASLRGETLNLHQFNSQDVAMLLLALGLVAGLFVDLAALEAYLQAADPEPWAGQSG